LGGGRRKMKVSSFVFNFMLTFLQLEHRVLLHAVDNASLVCCSGATRVCKLGDYEASASLYLSMLGIRFGGSTRQPLGLLLFAENNLSDHRQSV
jgi:hypothetical protein